MSAGPGSPRVLLVGPTSPPYAGIEAVTESLVAALHRCPGLAWRHFRSGKPVPNARRGHLNAANVWWTARRTAGLALTVARFRPDIVHLPLAHNRWGFVRDACFILIARLFGARVVLHAHNDSYDRFAWSLGPILRRLVPKVYRLARAVVVQGESLRGQFERLGLGERVAILTNHVDVDALRGTPRISSDGVYVVLLLGRVSFAKGAWDLAQAALQAAGRLGSPVRLLLTGETVVDDASVSHLADRSTDVRVLITRLLQSHAGCSLEVEYLGTLDPEAKSRALRSAEVLALPSYSEAQPCAVLEGAAAGLPVLVTAVGVLPELFERGLRGELVPPGDVNRLADALVALADPERRRLDGAANAAFARREFDLRLLPDRLQSLYARVMNRE